MDEEKLFDFVLSHTKEKDPAELDRSIRTLHDLQIEALDLQLESHEELADAVFGDLVAPEYVDEELHNEEDFEKEYDSYYDIEKKQAAEVLVAERVSSRLLAVRKRRHALESKLR